MRFRTLLCIAASVSVSLPHASCERGPGGNSAAQPAPHALARPLPDTLAAMFYNVENLFDFHSDGTEYDEYKPGWYGWTEDAHRAKLYNTAQVIAAAGADIVGLCEIENANALAELQAELEKTGKTFPYAAAAEAGRSATVTALLSRFPITEKFSYPVEKSRPVLEAAIAGGGRELRVFVNHWPSKRHPESARLEAARILKKRLGELPPDCDYVILGDLNANYNEFATFHTEGFDDTKGRTGINHILNTAADGAGTQSPPRFVCKGELAACPECGYNLWLELPEEKRMSYVYRGAAQTPDNMILPPSMFDTSGYSYLNGSFGAFTWGGELLRGGIPYRWQMAFRGKRKYHAGRGYSDHLPLTARFVWARPPAGAPDNRDSASSNHAGAPQAAGGYCENADPRLVTGDFAAATDGWVSGDSRFTVSRDGKFAQTGTHSLRVSGRHGEKNAAAAKAALEPRGRAEYLTLSIRGEGCLSIRVRRPASGWVYFNAPDFRQSKSARYKSWKSGRWASLKLPLPDAASADDDVLVELRAGKTDSLAVWIDRVRLE